VCVCLHPDAQLWHGVGAPVDLGAAAGVRVRGRHDVDPAVGDEQLPQSVRRRACGTTRVTVGDSQLGLDGDTRGCRDRRAALRGRGWGAARTRRCGAEQPARLVWNEPVHLGQLEGSRAAVGHNCVAMHACAFMCTQSAFCEYA
jgi:hypothetical protein